MTAERPLRIRDATPDDAEGIVAVFNPIIAAGTYTVFDEPIDVEAERDFIRRFSPRGIFHVAVDPLNDRILGFQNMEPIAGYTRAFDHVGSIATYVDLGSRRQGVASSLFRATFAAAPARGYEKAFTFVRADNPVALDVYLRQGFVVIGTARRQAKLRGAYIDEILIEKLL